MSDNRPGDHPQGYSQPQPGQQVHPQQAPGYAPHGQPIQAIPQPLAQPHGQPHGQPIHYQPMPGFHGAQPGQHPPHYAHQPQGYRPGEPVYDQAHHAPQLPPLQGHLMQNQGGMRLMPMHGQFVTSPSPHPHSPRPDAVMQQIPPVHGQPPQHMQPQPGQPMHNQQSNPHSPVPQPVAPGSAGVKREVDRGAEIRWARKKSRQMERELHGKIVQGFRLRDEETRSTEILQRLVAENYRLIELIERVSVATEQKLPDLPEPAPFDTSVDDKAFELTHGQNFEPIY